MVRYKIKKLRIDYRLFAKPRQPGGSANLYADR
jgi:hypothetical protein